MRGNDQIERFLARAAGDEHIGRSVIEALSESALRAAGLPEEFPDPAELAVLLGYRVLRYEGAWRCTPELTVSGRIYYTQTRDRRERATQIAHGLAHCLLVSERIMHGEAGAWRLTAELLAPARAIRGLHHAKAQEVAQFCPDWILRHRPILRLVG